MAIAATQFDLVERDIEFRHNHMPVIYDKGPFFQNAYALWLHAARPQSHRYQRWLVKLPKSKILFTQTGNLLAID